MEELNQGRQIVQLYTVGRLIQDGFSVIRRNIGVLLKIALLFTLYNLVFYGFSGGQTPDIHQPGILFLSGLLSLINVVVALFFVVALISAINELSEDKTVTLGNTFDTAVEKCGPFLWIGILKGLAIVGGYILLIVPGIIFSVWFLFSSYALILEDKRDVSALKRSKQLVKDHWWYICGITFAIGAIFGLVTLAVAIILWLFSHSIANAPLIPKTPQDMKSFFFVFSVPNTFISIPIYASFVLLFKNLREVKEGKNDEVITAPSVPYKLRTGE